jgi:outer membrane protein assembly factor BamB
MDQSIKSLAVVVFCLLQATGAYGANPLAPAPEYALNPSNTNVSAYVGIVSDPFVRWQIAHDRGQIDNPAVILDQRGVLFAQTLSPRFAATGQPAGINIPSARDSTPVIDAAGNIFQWVNGRMRAYSPTGTPLWSGPTTNFSDGYGLKMGPEGNIYANGGNNTLYAFSHTGTPLWSRPGFQTSNPPPAIDAGGNLYLVSGYVSGQYISYDPAGNQRWAKPWNKNNNFGPPILGPDGNLYVSEDYGTNVSVLNPATGATVRQQSNLYGGIQAISADGTLYSCSYQTVRATDLFGNTRWESHIPSSMYFQDLVVDAAGKVYCTTEQNQLFAYSPTGTQLWSMQLPTGYWQTLPPVVGADGSLYVQNGNVLMAIGGIVPEPAAVAPLIVSLLGLTFSRLRRR